MRISDWSSDVCSSDLADDRGKGPAAPMTDDVMIWMDGRVGRIALNRPKAIHALNIAMCDAMIGALVRWRGDDAVEAVIIDHSEGRGFCAGRDIRLPAASGAKAGVEERAISHTE